jgi:hypothetical protein
VVWDEIDLKMLTGLNSNLEEQALLASKQCMGMLCHNNFRITVLWLWHDIPMHCFPAGSTCSSKFKFRPVNIFGSISSHTTKYQASTRLAIGLIGTPGTVMEKQAEGTRDPTTSRKKQMMPNPMQIICHYTTVVHLPKPNTNGKLCFLCIYILGLY